MNLVCKLFGHRFVPRCNASVNEIEASDVGGTSLEFCMRCGYDRKLVCMSPVIIGPGKYDRPRRYDRFALKEELRTNRSELGDVRDETYWTSVMNVIENHLYEEHRS